MPFAEFAAFIIYLYVAIDFFWLAVLDIDGAFEHKLLVVSSPFVAINRQTLLWFTLQYICNYSLRLEAKLKYIHNYFSHPFRQDEDEDEFLTNLES